MNTKEIRRILRQALEAYEAQQNGVSSTVSDEPIKQMESCVDDIVGQIRALVDALAVPYRLWNSAGVDSLVMSAESAESAPEGSQYTQRWWYQAQSVFNAFRVWYNLPFGVMSQLSVEIEGETVQPFAFLQAVPVDGELTPLKIISSKPEQSTIITVEEEE